MATLYDSITSREMEYLIPLADEISAERSLRIQNWIRNHPGTKMPTDVGSEIFRESMSLVLKKVHDDSYPDIYRKVASILSKRSAENRKRKARQKRNSLPSSRTKKLKGRTSLYERATELARRETTHTQETLSLDMLSTPQNVAPEKTSTSTTKTEPEIQKQVQPVFELMAEVNRDCTQRWETGMLRTKKHRAGRW